MKNLILLLATILWLTMNNTNASSAFVSIKSQHLIKDGRPYYFMGTNYWQGMNLGAPGDGNHRAQLKRDLDMMQSQGIKQLRILALSEGPNSEPYRVVPAVQTKPKLPYGSLWKAGDPLLGDPPHEEQGWYGVYSSDHSTLNVIKKFADQIELRIKDQEI